MRCTNRYKLSPQSYLKAFSKPKQVSCRLSRSSPSCDGYVSSKIIHSCFIRTVLSFQPKPCVLRLGTRIVRDPDLLLRTSGSSMFLLTTSS